MYSNTKNNTLCVLQLLGIVFAQTHAVICIEGGNFEQMILQLIVKVIKGTKGENMQRVKRSYVKKYRWD